jgi:hypothetical protein
MTLFTQGRVVFVLVSLVACSRSSVPTGPAPAVTPAVRTLTVSGNGRLTAPGQTTQLTATAMMSDGSQKDITTTATWRSTPSSVATVQAGLVTAVDFGTASIDFVNQSGNPPGGAFRILVLPDGTYILSGQCVQDLSKIPDGRGECLADARIEIISGPMNGRTTTTDEGGNWTFNGVSGVLQVKATKEGYIPAVQDVPQPAAGDYGIAICGPGLVPVSGQSTRLPGCI